MSNDLAKSVEKEPKRFKLTMPQEEADLLGSLYAKSKIVLEYGSGGSTFIAAEVADKVFAVESDHAWAAEISASLAHYFPQKAVHVHYANIGPTKEWGFPKGPEEYRKFSDYPFSVWDRPDFDHPDLVLIDGRFRTACFLTVLFKITKPVTVLWDDYTGRSEYHEVEDLVKPVEIVGRMARFELTPMTIPLDKLHWVVKSYSRAR